MLDICSIIEDNIFDSVFLIASFHHLEALDEREKMMQNIYNILETWWRVYMTHWALESAYNKEKYSSSKIIDSKNMFWSTDFNIKFWEFARYYHCFDLSELEYLAKSAWFTIIENRIFKGERNMISILEK